MLRREMLKLLAALPFYRPQARRLYGWRKDTRSLQRFIESHEYPFLSQQDEEIRGTGAGKVTLLYKALERLTGPFKPHFQGTGDCVSHAYALGIDVLSAVQIVLKNKPEKWKYFAATEPIYGGSRIEVGEYHSPYGGSTGHWAAEWITQWGVLYRKPYKDWDFTYYSSQVADQLGQEGCPDLLEPLARLHPVKTAAICRTYEEARDSIHNGMPVVVCSDAGFGEGTCHRDKDGFLRRKRLPWPHAMLFAGMDDKFHRPGLLCFNSWGENWIDGPTRHNQPPGTFWVDSKTVDAMLEEGDSFSLSGLVGFPRTIIPPYVLI